MLTTRFKSGCALLIVAAALGIATQARAQTLVTGQCHADDFMSIVGNDQVFDLTISLYSTPSAADRLLYEEVLRHFARGVFEMTNGKHKIRNITIYQGGLRKRFADVVWARGHTQAEIDTSPTDDIDFVQATTYMGGIVNKLGKIYMFDDQQDVLSPTGASTDLVRAGPDQRKLSGYILTHEFGHYAYSLGDEYKPFYNGPQIVSIMSDVQKSIVAGSTNDNLQWLNFSTSSSINFAADFDSTSQHGINNVSSWEFLTKNCNNRSRSGQASAYFIPDMGATVLLSAFPQNVFYSRLVAPTSSNQWSNPNDGVPYPTMIPDLYGVTPLGNPTDLIKVTWADTANVEMDLILDVSGSMSGDPILKVKQAAQKFAGQAVIGRTTLGVTTFESLVNTGVVPMTRINSQADIQAIQTQIGNITLGDNTAMFAAAKDSLAKLQAFHNANGTSALQTAFLLSDGNDNASGGVTEDQVSQLYKAAATRLHTVGYADRNSSLAFLDPLRRMATATGGTFFQSLTEAADINEAMRVAYGDILTIQDIKLGDLGTPFAVDILYYQMTFDVTYRLNAGGGVSFALFGPGNVAVPVTTVTGTNDDGSFTDVILVNQSGMSLIGTGYWRLVPTFTGAGGTIVSKRCQATPAGVEPIELIVSSKNQDYFYPEPVQLYARTILDADITSLNLEAKLIAPDGSSMPIVMTDDGKGNDTAAFDGLYSAQVTNLTQNGTYTLEVGVENLGTAVYIRPRGEPSANGAPTNPRYVPVGIPFSRVGRTAFTVRGIVTDDYGNTPAAAAFIAPNGAPHFGKIETAGDVDFFRVDGAAAGQPLSVRVYDQRFGYVPKLTIYGADGATVLKSGSLLLGATPQGYLSVTVPGAQVVSPLYVKVEDQAGGAGGTYTLDVGPTTAADKTAAAPFITKLPNGDLQLAISFPAHQAYVEAFAEKNGAPLVSGNIVTSEVDNGDGTYTYYRVVPASNFATGNQIRVRFHSFETNGPAILTPGPTSDVWLPTYTYGGGFACVTPPVGSCASTLLTPVSATATSTQSTSYPASMAIDRDFSTRWSSAFSDPQSLTIDLGAPRFIHRAILYWEAAASSDFDIQVSNNATTWTTVYTDHAGNGGTDDVVGLNATGRYVRIYSRHRTSQYGNSLWEVLLWGDAATTCTTGPAPARACVPREPVRVGSLALERWNNVSGAAVSNIPTTTPPDLVTNVPWLETPRNAAENYGARMRGWITPPVTGSYTFWISGDDQVALYLSTGMSAANKTRIAYHTAYTGYREWNKYPTQKSAPVTLIQGNWYYLETLLKEQSGDDNVAVGWLKPGETGTQPSEVVPAMHFAPFADSSLPPPVSGGLQQCVNVNSSKCVDVAAASMNDGAAVQQLTCAATDGGQQFDLRSRGDGLYWLENNVSKKCVHVVNNGTAQGALIEQRTCDGSTSSIWQVVSLGSNRFKAVGLKSGKCLDVVGASTQSGARMQLSTCSSGLSQAFQFTPL